MKILLVDVDSKIPNLALMKLSTYHKQLGDEVEIIKLGLPGYPHNRKIKVADAEQYDKVYVSSIFTVNQDKYKIINCDNVEYGGTGYDLRVKLPQEIDDMKEDYSLYPDNKISYGYITRGCIRNCPFCVVPKKEGKLYHYRDWRDILQDEHKEISFMDNNFLAYVDHKKILQELIDAKMEVDFNQGLDIRLIDGENSDLLRQLKYRGNYTFAFDNISEEKTICEKLQYLTWGKNWRFRFFVYCNANINISNVIYRIMFCKKNKILPYLMRDKNCWNSKNKNFYIDLAAYCNQPNVFKKMTFHEYLTRRNIKSDRKISSLKIWNDNYAEPNYLVWE